MASEGIFWQISFWRGCWACSFLGAGVRGTAVPFPSPGKAPGGVKRCWGRRGCSPALVRGCGSLGALGAQGQPLGRGSLASPGLCGVTAQWEHGLSVVPCDQASPPSRNVTVRGGWHPKRGAAQPRGGLWGQQQQAGRAWAGLQEASQNPVRAGGVQSQYYAF